MPKQILFDQAAREALRRGVQKVADAVRPTLGPRGRTVVIRHDANRGVGAAIVTGYREATAAGADVLAVMAGDDQMDPEDLAAVVTPVVAGHATCSRSSLATKRVTVAHIAAPRSS